MEINDSITARFWSHVTKTDTCWVWNGATYKDHYGAFKIASYKLVRAHRLSWIMHHGEIPAGQLVLHRCDNRPCVNPDHLFLGTQAINQHDKVLKNRAGRKLTPASVLQIRSEYQPRIVPKRVLALKFGVSKETIDLVLRRKIWVHI